MRKYKIKIVENEPKYRHCDEFICDDECHELSNDDSHIMISHSLDHGAKEAELEISELSNIDYDKYPSILKIIGADHFDDGIIVHYENFNHITSMEANKELGWFENMKIENVEDIKNFNSQYKSHTRNLKCVSEDLVMSQIDDILNDQIKLGKFHFPTENQIVICGNKIKIGLHGLGSSVIGQCSSVTTDGSYKSPPEARIADRILFPYESPKTYESFVWFLGIALFTIFYGNSPFYHHKCNGKYFDEKTGLLLDEKFGNDFGDKFKLILKYMMAKDPKMRYKPGMFKK